MKPFKKSFTKNEGELKKRLHDNCFKGVADGECDFKTIENILDEAKKDIFEALELDHVEYHKHPLVVRRINKWFGEP